MLTSKEIRESYKQFFASKGHQIVPSAPMVIKDDPTLMFTNAGMNQFKDIILGNAPIKYPRIADSQKCLRVSGKHNDLEEVGHDTYHHTMFEMLGNWSFGDYFKKEAIEWAWEYLVTVLGLDPERLYATVFEGSPKEGLERDNEAAGYWEKFLPASRIINGNKKDNFWEMGDTGPCGPCSEIHVDIRSDAERQKIDGLSLVNQSHPQVIEIWNLVFMQYNRKADGSLEGLPAKVIDTGMGFERLCMALQGKQSNYDTDVFSPLIDKIAQLTSQEYGTNEKKDIAMRVIADHIRTIAFSIADSQLPSNAKAGYVIRRILRRAVRYGYTFLSQQKPFMHHLIPTLIESMGEAYPELGAQQTLIEKVIKEEEESFLRTLEIGIRLLDKMIEEVSSQDKNKLEGKELFTLYDTYGFPFDLTQLILKEKGFEADEEGFINEMNIQKERARNASAVETGDWIILKEGDSRFVGYDFTEYETEILRYRSVKQKGKESIQIVLAQTPFYGESGGQVGDTGILKAEKETIRIHDTKKENNLIVLYASSLPQDPTQNFKAIVNKESRKATTRNHTATHLLHEALREVLGTHVEQKGSFVTPHLLRFDFSHFQKVTAEELRAVEKIANQKVLSNIALQEYRDMPLEEAKKLGAMALFGEKYGESVRVIRYGSSVEFCAGTHLQATGEIGLIKIVSESSIAAGIRRIEALTGTNTEDLIHQQAELLDTIKKFLNNTPDIIQSIGKAITENNQLKESIDSLQQERAADSKKKLIANHTETEGIKIFRLETDMDPNVVKNIAFQLRGEFPVNSFFVAATKFGDKALLTVSLSDNLVSKKLNASTLVKSGAKLIQGGGGGQPHYATAGGKLQADMGDIIDHILKEADLL